MSVEEQIGTASRAAPRPALPKGAGRAGLGEFLTTAICLVLIAGAAALMAGSYTIYIVNLVLLASIGALGLNLLMGMAGQVSIGNAAFLTTGAFVTVWAGRLGLPFPLDTVVAMAAAGAFGAIVGLPALRIKGIYLILSTMAAHFVAIFLAESYQFAEVGSAGFIVDPVYKGLSLVGFQRAWVFTNLVIVIVVMLAFVRLQHGRTGRGWRMLRDREDAAPAMGIPVARMKLSAFVISSAVIGLQGSLMAHFTGNVSSESFPLTVAIAAIAMILIGGLGSVAGSVIGAAIVTTLPFYTPQVVKLIAGSTGAAAQSARISLILYGILIILFIGYAREGVRGWIVAAWHAIRSPR